jgi:hypothetical protein
MGAPHPIANTNAGRIDGTTPKDQPHVAVPGRFDGKDVPTFFGFFGASPVSGIEYHTITGFEANTLGVDDHITALDGGHMPDKHATMAWCTAAHHLLVVGTADK